MSLAVNTTSSGVFKRRSWTCEEDKILKEQVKTKKTWSQIALHLPHRSGKSCRERWMNHLNPNLDKSALTDREIKKIFRLVPLYSATGRGGRLVIQWSKMVKKEFPRRTDNQLKNIYHSRKASKRSISQDIETSNQRVTARKKRKISDSKSKKEETITSFIQTSVFSTGIVEATIPLYPDSYPLPPFQSITEEEFIKLIAECFDV
jgi:myb proto-oncogene protein